MPSYGDHYSWPRNAPSFQSADGRVIHLRSGQMVLLWPLTAGPETESDSRKIIGFRDLWMVRATLGGGQTVNDNGVSAVDEEHLAA